MPEGPPAVEAYRQRAFLKERGADENPYPIDDEDRELLARFWFTQLYGR